MLRALILLFCAIQAFAAVRNFTGFETGRASEYNSVVVGAGGSFPGAAARSGAYGFNCTQSTGNTNACYVDIRSPGQTAITFDGSTGVTALYSRVDFRFQNAPSSTVIFLTVRRLGALTNSTLRLNTDRTVSIYNSAGTLALTGTTVLATNTWYTLEYFVQGNDTTANTTVRIDGVDETNLTQTAGSVNAGTANISLVYVGKGDAADKGAVNWDFDNAVFSDTSFPADVDVRVALLAPTGAGAYTGFGAPSYTIVAEVPDSEGTYATSTANPDAVTFAMANWSSLGIGGTPTLYAVRPFIRIRDAVGATDGELRTRSGSTDTDLPLDDAQISASLMGFGAVYEADPADAGAWTTSKIDGLEVGVENTSANAMRLSSVSLHILYTPGAGSSGRKKSSPVTY